MKKLLFPLLLLLSAMIVSCKNDELKPQVIANGISVPSTGGQFQFTYSVDNTTIDVSKVVAETKDDWISEIDKSETGIIKFTAQENTSADERKAIITVSYPGAMSADVVITQRSSGDNKDFIITINSVSPYGAEITFTPAEYKGNYFFLVMEKRFIQKYIDEGLLDDLYEKDLKWLKSLAEYNAMPLSEFLQKVPMMYALNGTEITMPYTDLKPEVDYYAYCYGLSLEGEKLTDFTFKPFRTELLEPVKISFEAKATDITDKSAKITVKASDDSTLYFWTYVTDFEFNKYGKIQIVKEMTDNLKITASNTQQELANILCKGTSEGLANDLWANTDYHLVAWAMDEKGNLISDIHEELLFRTKETLVEDYCTFDVTCPNVKDMDIQINIKPSNAETRYYVACISSDKCKGYSDDQMVQRVLKMETDRLAQGFYGEGMTWENFTSLYKGEQTLWAHEDLYWTFKPDHVYRILVFGVDKQGRRTTAIKVVEQKTKPTKESHMTFQVSLSNESWRNGTFKVVPSNNEEYYFTHLIESSYLDTFRNKDGSINEKELMEVIEHYYDGEMVYTLKQGPWEGVYQWISDKNMVFLVCAYAGTNTGRFTEFKVKTPAIPFNKSKADLTAEYHLFDGAALYQMDPDRWDGYQEDCVMYMIFKPNEHASTWYGGVWLPVSNYEDVGGVHHLMNLIMNPTVSFVGAKTGVIRPWWENKWSFSYVAEDEQGNFGPWHYEEFIPHKDKVEKPWDFWSKAPQHAIIRTISKDDLR